MAASGDMTETTFSGEVRSSDFAPSGLSGAVALTRYVGGTTSGHPTSGTFAVGDFVVDQNGQIWICTVAGTPGTWTAIGGYVPQVKTADYTALATDSMLVAGASSLTFTLPAASAYGGKAPFVVKNDAFTTTTVAAAGTDTIDGAATYSLSAAQASVRLVAEPAAGKWRSI